MPTNVSPKVFISYSHDSKRHINSVLELSGQLREDGVDCQLDLYEESPRWMINQVESADFVLVVCTQEYNRRFLGNGEPGKGNGVSWEGAIILQELYESQARNSKFIPVVINKNDLAFVPRPLRSFTPYKIYLDEGYLNLLRRLTRVSRDALKSEQVFTPQPSLEQKTEFSPILKKEFLNLPRRNYIDFIGRDNEMSELIKRVSPGYRQHITVVQGIGGVGKTALVVEMAYQCWDANLNRDSNNSNYPVFEAIIFTSSKSTIMFGNELINRPEKEPLLTDIYRVISDVLEDTTITQVVEEEQMRQVYNALSRQSTLLIIDNMETLEEEERRKILSFLNDVPHTTQVIVTTRDFLGFDSLLIESLTKRESFQLLDSHAGGVKINQAWKEAVFQRFKGIPVALVYAIGMKRAHYSDEDILKSAVPIDKLGEFCFNSAIEPLRHTPAYKILLSMTFFSTPPCREALFKVAGLHNDQETIDALAKLQQLLLIKKAARGRGKGDRFEMLPMTREYTKIELQRFLRVDPEFHRSAETHWCNWYRELVETYGGLDWDGWSSKYAHLKEEWDNIELVLQNQAAKAKWKEVMALWMCIDNYVDLNGDWQKRRDWWAYLGEKAGSTAIRVEALSQKGSTLILMGNEHHATAEDYLNRAWDLRADASVAVKAELASHLAILAKSKREYSKAHTWLDEEESILQSLPDSREKERYRARNLFYRAEVNELEFRTSEAKEQLREVLHLTGSIGWQRFRNYAKNSLADILIKEDNLDEAKSLIDSGLEVAKGAGETRRIALFNASNARLHYKLAKKLSQEHSLENSLVCIDKSSDFANKALRTFTKENMVVERNDILDLLQLISDFQNESGE
jgi:hypothetical protein